MKVLIVAPHPDDEVLGCGGTIARHVAQGDEVHVAIVTRGIPELFPPEVIEGTRGEMRAAHKLLGISQTHEMDFPAPRTDTVAIHLVADQVRRVVRDVKAETVYLPHYGDMHHEHGIVYTAGLVACRPTHSPVKRVLTYEVLSETDWGPSRPDQAFVPNVFIDVTPFLQKKLDAMRCFKSQLHAPPAPRSIQALTALANYRGSTVGVEAAEAFTLVREIQ